jgi:hypothetical protein
LIRGVPSGSQHYHVSTDESYVRTSPRRMLPSILSRSVRN